jgi:hypothetical protein
MGCNQVFDQVLLGRRVNPPGQSGHPDIDFLYFL